MPPEQERLAAPRRAVIKDIAGELVRGRLHSARRMARTVMQRADLRTDKVLSRKYGYLWIANSKVASRSIFSMLREADPNIEIHRMSFPDLYAKYPEAENFYSFVFIRHPFTRAWSSYYHFTDRNRFLEKFRCQAVEAEYRRQCEKFYGLREVSGFDDYCLWLSTPYGSDTFADRHWLSQHVQIRSENGRLPDFIGRFENLEADSRQVADRLGMPVPALPTLNTTGGWQVAPEVLKVARSRREALLTERNKALLRTRYAGDFELGGYSP